MQGIFDREHNDMDVCVSMYADHSQRSHHQQAIEFLAQESRVPTNEVAQLYEDERTELEVDARITAFLGIFAIRNVRAMLRQRSAGKRAPSP
jgi:hypothetical protein